MKKLIVVLLTISMLLSLYQGVLRGNVVKAEETVPKESLSDENYQQNPPLFDTVISYVNDNTNDVSDSYSYLDIVYAEIRQINLDTLQFNMRLKSTIPLNPGKDVVAYLWMIDTDLNPNTGQRHVFVGSEYNIRVVFYDSHWQGWVDPIDQNPGGGQCPVFVDNDTVSIIVKRSQIGNATKFNWEVNAFDNYASDIADSYATCQVLTTLTSPDVASEILINPSFLRLSNGITSGNLAITIKYANGNSTNVSSAKFFVDHPSMLSVTDNGTVTASAGKIGYCWVTAEVDGILTTDPADVAIGSIELLPPILLLSLSSNPTGTLELKAFDAYGNSVTPNRVEFSSSNPQVATVSETGLVTALRPPKTFNETPYISAKADGIPATNDAVIRVTNDDLGITLDPLSGKHITFYVPRKPIQGFDYQKIFKDYDVVRITDIAYELESEATGVVPSEGGMLFLVNDPGHESDGTVPCGLSGNPIRLGTEVDKPYDNSCMIVAEGNGWPQWGVFFHEMGHDFSGEGIRINQFLFGGSPHSTFVYAEGFATALGMYVAKMIKERASLFNIPNNIVDNIESTVWHFGSTPDLDNYLKNGAHYDNATPSVLDDMIDVICTKYGYDSLFRFFSLFLPRNEPFPFVIDSDTKQATVFVAAFSAATRVDLREQFRTWGFPIDDEYYSNIWDEVNKLVHQRAIYAVTTTSSNGGTIIPSGRITVKGGGEIKFAIIPDMGHRIVDVKVDGASIGPVSTYTFQNITSDHTIEATFAINIYNITASAGLGGSITPSGTVTVNYGDSKTFTITPDKGYKISDVKVDGKSVGSASTYTFQNVTADHTIEATFAINTYNITALAGSNGSISPSGNVTVNYGDSKTFTITPNIGYHIADVKVDGVSVGAVSTYTFSNITDNHRIEATFEKNQIVIVLQVGQTIFTVNGSPNTLDSPPIIKNGRTLLPIRPIVEALGGTVSWDGNEKKVTVTLGSTTIELWIGKNTARVNGTDTPIDSTNPKVVPEIINGRTMLPLRFVTENLGCELQWDPNTKTITITYQG